MKNSSKNWIASHLFLLVLTNKGNKKILVCFQLFGLQHYVIRITNWIFQNLSRKSKKNFSLFCFKNKPLFKLFHSRRFSSAFSIYKAFLISFSKKKFTGNVHLVLKNCSVSYEFFGCWRGEEWGNEKRKEELLRWTDNKKQKEIWSNLCWSLLGLFCTSILFFVVLSFFFLFLSKE